MLHTSQNLDLVFKATFAFVATDERHCFLEDHMFFMSYNDFLNWP